MKKVIKYILSILLVVVVFAFYHVEIDGNFYKIDDDVYRSGKLNDYNLPYYTNKYKIKTILNLHGESSKAWYEKEKVFSKNNGITHIDFKMNSGKYYDESKMKDLIDIMKNSEKPMLIHCLGGADRTSLAAALYEYAIKEKSVEVAREQLHWSFGHVPFFRPHVINMDKSFDNYIKENKRQIDDR